MKLGLFMMPLHDPNRDYTRVLQEDREAILLAEKLGYEEAWVGEHYSARTEPIPDPLQFMATAEAYSRMYREAEAHPDSEGAQLAGTPIGQIAGMMNSVRPVRDVIFDMVEQYGVAVERMKSLGV